ncbi:MAG: hypothetical protein U0Q16_34585 [Bryobacteraceae bacterium]
MKQFLLGILVAAAAMAADVTGNWKATAEGPNGAMERTFALKADGEKLTGETVSSFAGKSQIRDGKVKGDDLSFVITINIQGNEMEVAYKGKVVNKDEIKFTADVGGNTIEWMAKRQ